MASEPDIDFTLAEKFVRHWSIDDLVKEVEDLTYGAALEYLAQDEVIEYLDAASEKLAKVYSRMPPYIAATVVMNKMRNARGATDSSAAINSFHDFMKNKPPPSDTSFIEDVYEALELKVQKEQNNAS